MEPRTSDIYEFTYFSGRVVISKGALEEVIKVCSFVKHVDGTEMMALSLEDYERILKMAEELSSDGLRLLGVAIKRLETVCSDLSLIHYFIYTFTFMPFFFISFLTDRDKYLCYVFFY